MFSLIFPIDDNRLEQFHQTKLVYDAMPEEKEFILPTRSLDKVYYYLKEHNLMKDVRLIPYAHTVGFNPAKALNIGVRNARYDQVIVSSPEVKPKTEVLSQLKELIGQNVICQVWDEDENHKVIASLVHNGFRSENPGMYFLAMFNKRDIESINGWDEDFMHGYGYEDNDFGDRWNRAGLPFIIREDIEAVHQYHPRTETIPGGLGVNQRKHQDNNSKGVVWCENGLKKDQ